MEAKAREEREQIEALEGAKFAELERQARPFFLHEHFSMGTFSMGTFLSLPFVSQADTHARTAAAAGEALAAARSALSSGSHAALLFRVGPPLTTFPLSTLP